MEVIYKIIISAIGVFISYFIKKRFDCSTKDREMDLLMKHISFMKEGSLDCKDLLDKTVDEIYYYQTGMNQKMFLTWKKNKLYDKFGLARLKRLSKFAKLENGKIKIEMSLGSKFLHWGFLVLFLVLFLSLFIILPPDIFSLNQKNSVLLLTIIILIVLIVDSFILDLLVFSRYKQLLKKKMTDN